MKHTKILNLFFAGAMAGSVLFVAGCNKSATPATSESAASQPASQPTAPNDSQISSDVQGRIQADSGLTGATIQAQANNGIVTLSGTVADEAARELAANDAAQANGVRTVVNNLTVQAAKASAPSDAAAVAARQRADEEARRRRQQEQARLQREKQRQQAKAAAAEQAAAEQAQNAAPPPVVQRAPVQPPPPPPPPQPVTQMVTVPPGTDLAVRITETLESGKTQTNDSFHGVLADNLVLNGLTVLKRGTNVSGVVLDSKDATHFKGQSELSLGLQQIQTHSQALQISTTPVVRQGKARGKNTAVKAGGGALLGTLIGALAGGGRGALVGAAAGAGVGAGANAVTRGDQVQIPSESVLHFTLSQPVTVKVTTMPGNNRWNSQGNTGNSGSPLMQPPPN